MKSISEAIQNWIMRERDRNYAAELSIGDQEDLGLTRAEALELINGRADTRERMLAMAAKYGLSAEDIDRDRQTCLDVSLACGKCRAAGVCARYLAGDRSVSPLAFCPNADTYAEMSGAA